MNAPPIDRLWLYPIIDRAAWIPQFAACGIDVVQLRIKDLSASAREQEFQQAAALSKCHRVRLIINDDWEAARRYRAYGVHLGQDDLDGAPVEALYAGGLRLGISTHNAAEILRAESFNPSYIAIGTIFESPSKSFAHQPIGLEGFRELRAKTARPVVAIGGLRPDRAAAIRDAGADACAVISDLLRAPDLAQRVAEWRRAWFGLNA